MSQRIKPCTVPRGIIRKGLDKLSISGDECKVIIWPSLLFISLTCSDGITHGKADAQGAFAALTSWASILMLMSMVLCRRSLWGPWAENIPHHTAPPPSCALLSNSGTQTPAGLNGQAAIGAVHCLGCPLTPRAVAVNASIKGPICAVSRNLT